MFWLKLAKMPAEKIAARREWGPRSIAPLQGYSPHGTTYTMTKNKSIYMVMLTNAGWERVNLVASNNLIG